MSQLHSYCGKNDLRKKREGVDGNVYVCAVCGAKHVVKPPYLNNGKLSAIVAKAS